MKSVNLFHTITSFPGKLAKNWPEERPQQALFTLGIVLAGIAIFGVALPTISALTTTALFLSAAFIGSMYFLERAICGQKSLLGDISATSEEFSNDGAESLFSLIPRKIKEFVSDRFKFFAKLQQNGKINFEGFTATTTAGKIFEFTDRLFSGLIYGLCVLGMASMAISAIASAGVQLLSVVLIGGLSLYLVECAQNPGTASCDWGDISSMLMFKQTPQQALSSIFSRRYDFAMRSIDTLADLFGVNNVIHDDVQVTPQTKHTAHSKDAHNNHTTKIPGTEPVKKESPSVQFSSAPTKLSNHTQHNKPNQ